MIIIWRKVVVYALLKKPFWNLCIKVFVVVNFIFIAYGDRDARSSIKPRFVLVFNYFNCGVGCSELFIHTCALGTSTITNKIYFFLSFSELANQIKSSNYHNNSLDYRHRKENDLVLSGKRSIKSCVLQIQLWNHYHLL